MVSGIIEIAAHLGISVKERQIDRSELYIADSIKKRLATLSAEPWGTSPEEFDRFIRKEVAQTLKLAAGGGTEEEQARWRK